MAGIKPGMGQLLADVQVISLAANTQGFPTVSGSTYTQGSNTTQMTPNSVNSTQPVPDTYWDGLYMEVFPGVLAAGASEPDLQLTVKVDDIDYSPYFYVDISVSGNMLPPRDNTVGRSSILIGNSMIRVAISAQRSVQRGAPLSRSLWPINMPLEFTGFKITKGIDFWFSSTSGFTSSTFVVPPTVKLYGDVYDENLINFVVSMMPFGWDGFISIQSARRALASPPKPPYVATQQSTLTPKTFSTLPGGPKQSGVKVFRFLKYSVPLVSTSGQAIFPLTSLVEQIGGKTGSVGLSNDLGFAFRDNNNALYVREYGRIPGSGAGYAGITSGGTDVYPPETAYGLVCTPGDPRVPYGQVQPYRPESDLYYRLPRWGDWSPGESGPEVIAGETMAFYVSAQNGTTISANTDKTAVGGAMIVA